MSKADNKEDLLREMKEHEERKWLFKRGMGTHASYYSDEERKMLIEFFKQIDSDNDGKISHSDLSEVLIAFGLAESYAEVRDLMTAVDEDRSGYIDFNEFCGMIQGPYSPALFVVIQKMIKLELKHKEQMPLPLMASTFRRRMLMASMMETGPTREHGQRFMKSFSRIAAAQQIKEEKSQGI